MIKILELQLQHSPSSEYSGFISLKTDWIDWCDLLAVQGTLKSLIQYHSLKTLTLGHSIFFTVQLFTSGGQNIGASASALPMSIQG